MNKEQKLEQFNDILYAMGLPTIEVGDKPKSIFKEQEKKVEERTKQDNALDAVRYGKFIIGSIDTNGTISFSANPMTHDTAVSARTECARLARNNVGKAFVFVKLAGAELVPTSSVSI